MEDLESITDHLQKWDEYQKSIPVEDRSACLEFLLAEAISHILRLDFFTQDDDHSKSQYKVVWNGKVSTASGRTKYTRIGGPDAHIVAHDFTILLEATQKTGRAQWSGEYARAVSHYEGVCAAGSDKLSTYLLFVPVALAVDSYTSIKHKCTDKWNFAIISKDLFVIVLETYRLAFTAKHFDLRQILINTIRSCDHSTDIDDFLTRANADVAKWKRELLREEKLMFIGIKSYLSILRRSSRVGTLSELYQELSNDELVKEYFTMAEQNFNITDITTALETHRMASVVFLGDEVVFYAVPISDIKGRVKRFLKELENANSMPQKCKTP